MAAAVDRNLGVQGPMARNVEDLALLLDAMSGEHPADPLSLPVLPNSFLSAARSGSKPKRVAYSPDLGITPVDPEVAAITRKAAQRFAEAGAIVEEAHPDLREAHECFHVLRAFDFALSKAALLRTKRDLLKPEVIWNIEEGLKLTVEQLERAEAQRVAMTARTLEFFEKYDLLLCPATIVPPFPVENRYVAECAGKKFDNYVEWLGIVYAITLVCCPGAVAAVRLYRLGPAGRAAGGGAAARRGAAAGRQPGCWRIFWAYAGRRRSIQGRRNRGRRNKREYGRRERAAAREQADAQQGALGARGEIPHRKGLATRGGATAAGTAPDQGLADARSRTDAEHFARALAARRLRRGRKSDLLGLLRSSPRSRRASSCPTFTASPPGRATTTSGRGLATRDLLDACRPRDEARFVVLHSHDGYTTNLALEDFAAEDAILVHSWSGAPLEQEHGGPVRLVVPHLYFWKSAKWLQSIEFLAEDAPGYWEVRGYHNRGDPWAEAEIFRRLKTATLTGENARAA